jgi:NADH dehydrogenase FAD-containing subunit
MKSNNLLRIVILGAGYAGMFLAINVYQSFKEMHKSEDTEVQLMLISKLF